MVPATRSAVSFVTYALYAVIAVPRLSNASPFAASAVASPFTISLPFGLVSSPQVVSYSPGCRFAVIF
ncbi:hypothetical protein D3C72_2490090 [compost metagenome]